MNNSVSANDLYDVLRSEINKGYIKKHCEVFGKLQRFSGSPDAEEAANYILTQFQNMGASYRAYRFPGHLSRHLDASLRVISPYQVEYDVLSCGFSGNVDNLEGELYYDYMSEKETLSQRENKKRYSEFNGKIILTWSSAQSLASEAKKAGALGIITIWKFNDPVPHYLGAGTIWGNPTPDKIWQLHELPCLSCRKMDGEQLITALKAGPVIVSMTTKVSKGITECTIPVAYIPGKSDKFVLISGHYDAHGYGMTDNGAGDAIMLELFRILFNHQELLSRSVLLCLWSGHEDCPYAGSVWFSDNNWEMLRDRCVAHINIDVTGCRNTKQIRARTTRMEGKSFTDKLIKEFTGREPLPYIPLPHVGEQSFLGREIPITIMFKYEAAPEDSENVSIGGGYWWHSRDDTLDKVDYDICMRDAKINLKAICSILNADVLPVNMIEFTEESEHLLREIDEHLEEEFDLSPIYPKLAELRELLTQFVALLPGRLDTDQAIKSIAGELIRIQFTYRSPYEYDKLGTPSNFQKFRAAMGVTHDNTEEVPYLYILTDFIRQRNRYIGELDKIMDRIRYQILLWK